MLATRYMPTVDWKTVAKNVILLTAATETTPATFRVTVKPIDVNEPGAALAVKEVGFYLVDFVGHIYSIKTINVGGHSDQIEVLDDFFTGVCPQIERPARIYKSVWKGRSPFLAPVKLDNLDKTARDYLRSFEVDVLFSNDPNAKKIPFTNNANPGVINYQDDQEDPEDPTKTINYKNDFGDDPLVRIILTADATTKYHSMQNAIFTYDGDLLQSFTWELGDPTSSGYIIISKS